VIVIEASFIPTRSLLILVNQIPAGMRR